jgi:hypothetical protein
MSKLKTNWERGIYFLGFFRFIGSLLVFINPLYAISIVWLADMIDGHFAYHAGWSWQKYNQWDKLLDLWWYLFIISFSFTANLQIFPLLIALFILRLIGQILVLITNQEGYFLIFPNIFELYFAGFIILSYFADNPELPLLFLSGMIALLQEYRIHIRKISIGHILPIRGLKIDWSKNK